MKKPTRLLLMIFCLFFISAGWKNQLNGGVNFTRYTIDSNYRAFFITAYDLDKDGDPDVISGRHQLAWYRNDGNANFTKKVLGNFSRLFSVFPVDLDKDGDIDLLTADITETTIRWYRNKGNTTFEEIHLIDDVHRAESVAAADFDHDGDLDIAVVTCETELVFWCENTGNFNYETRHILETDFYRGHKVAVVDFNGDGWMDITGVCAARPFCWWKNLGNKQFQKRNIIGSGGLGFGIDDITKDGATDIIHCDHGGGIVTLLTNNGSGSFSQKTLSTGEKWPSWATVGDVNGDGMDDFVLVNGGRRDGPMGDLVYFENKGGSNFDRYLIPDSEMNVPFMADLADLDGDGDLDVVSGYEYDYKLYWWKNGGGGGVTETVSTPNTPTGSSSGTEGSNLQYSTGGSVSNLGHNVEYRFNWDDGNYSSWGSATNDHTFQNAGTYQVRAQARCTSHTSITSGWSGSKSVTITGVTETVSTPQRPSGPSSGMEDQTLSYSTTGSTSNLGHSVEYQFYWGDGNQSGWGSSSQSHIFTNEGTYQVRARARCKTHTNIVSDYSNSRTVTIIAETVSSPSAPTGPSSGVVGQTLSYTAEGAESNVGHELHHQFAWGNGQQSSWDSKTQQYSYSSVGAYDIRARARCAAHPNVVSGYSSVKTVIISPNQYEISGDVTYYSNQAPIQNVNINVLNGASTDVSTDENGSYEFTVTAGDNINVTPSKIKGEDIGGQDITVYDAVLVARYFYQVAELDSGQQIAADADSSGTVNLDDAVLIARFAIGVEDAALSHVSEWLFSPDERTYQNINSNQTDQDFVGCIIGNVHGGWFAPEPLDKKAIVSHEYTNFYPVRVGEKEILIRLQTETNQNVLSAEIEIIYESDDLKFSKFEKTELTKDFEAVINDQPGRLRMGLYSAMPINNDGNFIDIVFDIRDMEKQSTKIELKKFLINDVINNQATAEVNLTNENIQITQFALSQNYPNPFNAGTKIRFEMPEKEHVVLNIYNELGQLVKKLVNEIKDPGRHEVLWNGLNDNGEKESSGIKLYKIIYKDKIEVRKMILLN